jgi:cytochrome c biogenesis protein CcmG/thiol:disulfide interchange protein DsbE
MLPFNAIDSVSEPLPLPYATGLTTDSNPRYSQRVFVFRSEQSSRMDKGSRASSAASLAMIAVLALTAAFPIAASLTTAKDAKSAPDVTFLTAQGSPLHLGDLKGRVVLVDFWASWCPPCKTSFPALDGLYREFQERGLEVLAVNVDERYRDADAFLSTHPHAMTVLFDPKGSTPKAFSVEGMPSSFLIDRAGTIRFTHVGYSGNVAEQYRREVSLLLSER